MKHLKVWKRNGIVAAIVLFVCAAVYMNWSYSENQLEAGKTLGEAALVAGEVSGEEVKDGASGETDEAQITEETSGSDYFSTARLNRQQARDSARSLLQEAATDENATEDAIAEANFAIQTMADYTLTEAQVENLVVAKGYTNCVAFLNENSVSVVVSGVEDGLSETDVAKIGEIVVEQTGLSPEQIKIIETN